MRRPCSESANAAMGKFFDNLTLVFIALKLSGHIDWSWWLVLAPVWASALLGFSVVFWPKFKHYRAQAEWRKKKEARNGSE